VSLIARTIARALRLNEDLTEAVALGHDLGHTPFGHLGEEVLDQCLRRVGGAVGDGFHHAAQSLRVVDSLESRDSGGAGSGLNLTWEVRDGIRQHSSGGRPATREGLVVQVADRIAYLNHDIDDALRAGVIEPGALPGTVVRLLGGRHSVRINTMVVDVIEHYGDGGEVGFSSAVGEVADELERFMFASVYLGQATVVERNKAARLLHLLFEFYLANPAELAGPFGRPAAGDLALARLDPVELARAAADYVAGMTDRFAIEQFEKYFVPSPLRIQ
jgi:dGTPase